jgi:hypothetical protein
VRFRFRPFFAGLAAIIAGACGTATNHSNPIGTAQATAVADYAHAAEASCTTGEANGKPLTASCVFVLADGRRFTCPQRFAHAVQTASSLEHSTACRPIARLGLSAAVRRVTTTIESTQACLTSRRVRAIGNAVLPPLADPSSPDGELIAGYLPNGALIAFYRDREKATRLEPQVLRNTHRVHGQVERRGAATIFWSRPPTPALRSAVQGCVPAA